MEIIKDQNLFKCEDLGQASMETWVSNSQNKNVVDERP